MKDRVQIEDYQPEKNRDQRDKEHKEKMAEAEGKEEDAQKQA